MKILSNYEYRRINRRISDLEDVYRKMKKEIERVKKPSMFSLLDKVKIIKNRDGTEWKEKDNQYVIIGEDEYYAWKILHKDGTEMGVYDCQLEKL